MDLKRGLILDRDGVINVDIGYLHRIEDCVFIDGIFELLQAFQSRGFRLIIATNQTGIGRGYYDEAQFHALMDWMRERFRDQGIEIDAVYFCPDHPTEGLGVYRRPSIRRKPGPGMFLEAIDAFGLDPHTSWALGDGERDMAAAAAAGIGHRVLFDPQGIAMTRHDGVIVATNLSRVTALLTAHDNR